MLVIGERHSSGGAVVGPRLGYIIIIIDHLRMQPEGYGAAIYIFELLGSYRIFVPPVSFPAGLRGQDPSQLSGGWTDAQRSRPGPNGVSSSAPSVTFGGGIFNWAVASELMDDFP